MIIELKQLFEIVDEQLMLACSVDLKDYELSGQYPFTSPAVVEGKIFNRAGIVTFTALIKYRLDLVCDRCLDEFSKDFWFHTDHILVADPNTDSDEIFAVPDMRLDLDELVISDILLNLPSKLLCKEDCKGLCQQCGQNLNVHDCNCKKTNVDPRLAILGTLLD